MRYKPYKLEHIHDPASDRSDLRKVVINEEIRRQAVADAERSFQNVRKDLRRLIRSCRGQVAE